MVFDYMDHDMTGLLQRANLTGRHFTIPQVGSWGRRAPAQQPGWRCSSAGVMCASTYLPGHVPEAHLAGHYDGTFRTPIPSLGVRSSSAS